MRTMKFTVGAHPILWLFMMLAGLALPLSVSAHGAGMTFSATSTTEDGKQHIVDVDYSDLGIEAQRIGRFDFNLFSDNARTKSVEFTDMWVRITQDNGGKNGKTLFAGAIAKQEFGGNGFSLVFPKGGKYKLNVRYNDANLDDYGATVAEAEFELDVYPSAEETSFKYLSKELYAGLGGGLLIAVLGIIGYLWWRKKYV